MPQSIHQSNPDRALPSEETDARLDVLLDRAAPLPEAPWFTTRVLARIRQESAPAGIWDWIPLPIRQALPAAILLTVSVFGILSLSPSTPHASLASEPAEATQLSNPSFDEILELEDLDILVADLQMEIWLHDSPL